MRLRTAIAGTVAALVLTPAAAHAAPVRTATNPYYAAGSHSGGVAHTDSRATGHHLRLDASWTCPTTDCGLASEYATDDGEARQAAWVRERFPTNGRDFEITVTMTISDYATYAAHSKDEVHVALYVLAGRDGDGFRDYCRSSDHGLARDVTGDGTFTWTCTAFAPRWSPDTSPHLLVDVKLNAYLTQRSSLLAPTTGRATAVVESVTLREVTSRP